MQEAYDVGKAKGVHLEEEDIVRHQNRFENKLADDATSSLQKMWRPGSAIQSLRHFADTLSVWGESLG